MVCEGIEEHYQKRVLKELGGWGLKDKVNAAMVIRMRLICDYDRRWRKCWKQVPIRKAKGGLNSNSRRMAVTNWILALPSPSLSYLPPSFLLSLSPSTLSPGSCLVFQSCCSPRGLRRVQVPAWRMPVTVLDISVWCVCVCLFCHVLTAESDTILDQRKTHHNLREKNAS